MQVLVVGFDEPVFRGEVLAELARLDDSGIVRLLDALLVSRQSDGTFQTLPPPSGMPPDTGELAAALLGRPDGPDSPAGDVAEVADLAWSLSDAVPAGSAAAVVLIEHTWALPLRDAIQRAGGVPLDEAWLAQADLQSLEELMQLRRS
ncbi:MAG: hypothetical protein ACOYBY_14220 [Dermatophilaceae bacterium]